MCGYFDEFDVCLFRFQRVYLFCDFKIFVGRTEECLSCVNERSVYIYIYNIVYGKCQRSIVSCDKIKYKKILIRK